MKSVLKAISCTVGNGEQGEAATLPPGDACNVDESLKKLGFNGCLSESISVERSMRDTRPEG